MFRDIYLISLYCLLKWVCLPTLMIICSVTCVNVIILNILSKTQELLTISKESLLKLFDNIYEYHNDTSTKLESEIKSKILINF